MYYQAEAYRKTGCCYGPARTILTFEPVTAGGHLQAEVRPRFGNGWLKPLAGTVAGGTAGDMTVTIRDAFGNALTPLLKITLSGANGTPTLALAVADPGSVLIVGGRLSVRELIRLVNIQSPGAATGLVYLDVTNLGTPVTSMAFEWEAA